MLVHIIAKFRETDQKVQKVFFFLVILWFFRIYFSIWLTEDSFISLRVAENIADGWGFVYNVGERVLVVTNPLWTMMMSVMTFFFSNHFYGLLLQSIFVSSLSLFVLVFFCSKKISYAIPALLAICGSRYYIDYSTGGLENPMVNLMMFCYLYFYLPEGMTPNRLKYLSFFTGLALMCRPDTGALLGPLCLHALYQSFSKESIKQIFIGASPFLVWCLFALFYFGSPIPNTAFAKMSHGFEGDVLYKQGLMFLKWSFQTDPILIFMLIILPVYTLFRPKGKTTALAIVILLFFLYQIKIGGGYMAGRFLTAPFAISLVILTQYDFKIEKWFLPIIVIFALIDPAWYFFGNGPWGEKNVYKNHNISDARNYDMNAQLRVNQFSDPEYQPQPPPEDFGKSLQIEKNLVRVAGAIGFPVYKSGIADHVVDLFALSDPLLARLPAINKNFSPGHLIRPIPEGYLQSLRTGENHITDEKIAALYEKLDLLHHKDLFHSGRFSAIVYLLIHGHSEFIDVEYWKQVPPKKITYEVARKGDNIKFGIGGLQIDFKKNQKSRNIGLGMEYFTGIKISFYNGDELLGEMSKLPVIGKQDPQKIHTFKLSKNIRTGFDKIRIEGTPHSEQSFVFGYLGLNEKERPRGIVSLKEVKTNSETDKLEMWKFLRRMRGHVLHCYESSLKVFPDLAGDISFTVRDVGLKLEVEYENNLPEYKKIQNCLTHRLNKVRRPRLDDVAVVHYNLESPKE